MKLYHGSKNRLDRLEPRQASTESSGIPAGELLHGIYLTPDYGFAVAAAARPENSRTDIDEETKTMTFSNPENFRPDENIYIHSIDSENIPSDKLKQIDERQYVVLGEDFIEPEEIEETKARRVLDFYEITNWREGEEANQEHWGERRAR